MSANVFAEIKDGKIIRTIVVDKEVLDLGLWGDPKNWVQIEEEIEVIS